jgi:ParB family transcriptional regulator, chromosome partitioning protein
MPQSPKVRSRLGRGLNSLLSLSIETADLPAAQEGDPAIGTASGSAEPTSSATMEISVDRVSPNPHQPRKSMDSAKLLQLAESLKSSGLIQPIVVRRVETGYQLIAGQRRLEAARLAGLKSIPAIVRDVDSLSQAQLALVENIQREDLNPLDRAAAYRALIDRLGLTQAELATRLGEERSGIANYLRLLDLASPVKQFISDGKITLGHAKLLAGIDDLLEQQRIAELVVAQELSVRNLERLIEHRPTTPQSRPAASTDAYITDLEKNISQQLGMRVQVRRRGKGAGKMVVHYASLDQFDELLARMGLKLE